jgi:hypothetical protein
MPARECEGASRPGSPATTGRIRVPQNGLGNETASLARRSDPETKRRLSFSLQTQGIANMQFNMNLIWDLSRSSSLAAVSQEKYR